MHKFSGVIVCRGFNPLIPTLKSQSNGPLYEVGTLAVDGWAVTFGTARMGLGGLRPAQSNFIFIYTNFILFDVAL